jgi:hypothetical protein
LNGDHEAFTDVNVQLADVWSDIVQDIGRQLSCPVNPIELSINWHEIHERLVDALRYTAFNRYLQWFDAERHRVWDKAEGRHGQGPYRFVLVWYSGGRRQSREILWIPSKSSIVLVVNHGC